MDHPVPRTRPGSDRGALVVLSHLLAQVGRGLAAAGGGEGTGIGGGRLQRIIKRLCDHYWKNALGRAGPLMCERPCWRSSRSRFADRRGPGRSAAAARLLDPWHEAW